MLKRSPQWNMLPTFMAVMACVFTPDALPGVGFKLATACIQIQTFRYLYIINVLFGSIQIKLSVFSYFPLTFLCF